MKTGFVREKKRDIQAVDYGARMTLSGIKGSFDTRFWIFIIIMILFTLGNSSDFFVILRAQNLGAPLIQVVLMLVLFNAVYASFSLPMGILSDKLGRKRVIILGWFVYALAYLGFALSSRKVRGGIGMHLGIGITITFTFILFMKISTTFATNGNLNPALASWIPNIIFGIVGLILLRMAQK